MKFNEDFKNGPHQKILLKKSLQQADCANLINLWIMMSCLK